MQKGVIKAHFVICNYYYKCLIQAGFKINVIHRYFVLIISLSLKLKFSVSFISWMMIGWHQKVSILKIIYYQHEASVYNIHTFYFKEVNFQQFTF